MPRKEPSSRQKAVSRRRNKTEVSCCMKYMIFGFNIVFWITGLALLLAGIYAEVEKNPFRMLGRQLTKFYLDPALVLIIIGATTFILGFSGCIGALRENTCMLSFYATTIGTLFFLQITATVLGFVFKDWAQEQLQKELDHMIVSYREDNDLQSVIDWIQADWLKCCGLHGPNDWDMNIYFNMSSAALGSPEAGGVPFSCCVPAANQTVPNLYCGHKVRRRDYSGHQEIYRTGCLDSILKWIHENLIIVGSIAIAILVLEILGICFAQSLRADILTQRERYRRSHIVSNSRERGQFTQF